MLYCSELDVVTVRADPAMPKDLRDVAPLRSRWNELVCGDEVLSNGVDAVDWSDDPVQVVVCSECGTPQCSDGGYARIRRVGDLLLWTRPRADASDEWGWARYRGSELLERHGNVIMPADRWDATAYGSMPRAASFPRATRRDLLEAWLVEMPRTLESTIDAGADLRALLRERLEATDRIDNAEALAAIDAILAWGAEAPHDEPDLTIERIDERGATLVTLHFSGNDEWPALVLVDGILRMALGAEHVIV